MIAVFDAASLAVLVVVLALAIALSRYIIPLTLVVMVIAISLWPIWAIGAYLLWQGGYF